MYNAKDNEIHVVYNEEHISYVTDVRLDNDIVYVTLVPLKMDEVKRMLNARRPDRLAYKMGMDGELIDLGTVDGAYTYAFNSLLDDVPDVTIAFKLRR